MKTINKITASLLVASSLLNADIGLDSIGFNLGSATFTTEQTNKLDSITLANEPETQYLHGEIYALIGGVFEDQSYKPSINYILSDNKEFTNHLFMVGINKYFSLEDYNLYAGLLVGNGMLNWKSNPIDGTKDNDTNVQSPVGAIQVGAEYQVSDKFSLGVNSKYYLHDYLTSLEPTSSATAKINHTSFYSIVIGLRYSFGSSK